MATDPLTLGITTDVGAVAKLADDGLALVAEPIKSAQIDKPINEANDRVSEYENILSETDPDKLDSDLGAFVGRLLLDASIAPGELSGRTRRVPVEYLTALILGVIDDIRQREQKSVAATAK